MTNPTEIPGLPQHGDMALDCGLSDRMTCGRAIEPANQYFVTIRDSGQNKTIFVSGENLLRFAEKARQVVGANE